MSGGEDWWWVRFSVANASGVIVTRASSVLCC